MQNQIIEQGLDLLVFGMGTVFFFLAMLVVVTTIMSRIMTRFFAEAQPEPQQTISAVPDHNPHLIAVFKAAIEQHKAKQ